MDDCSKKMFKFIKFLHQADAKALPLSVKGLNPGVVTLSYSHNSLSQHHEPVSQRWVIALPKSALDTYNRCLMSERRDLAGYG